MSVRFIPLISPIFVASPVSGASLLWPIIGRSAATSPICFFSAIFVFSFVIHYSSSFNGNISGRISAGQGDENTNAVVSDAVMRMVRISKYRVNMVHAGDIQLL